MYNKPFKEELAAYRRQKVKEINDPGNLALGNGDASAIRSIISILQKDRHMDVATRVFRLP
jgi:hypothetical protein